MPVSKNWKVIKSIQFTLDMARHSWWMSFWRSTIGMNREENTMSTLEQELVPDWISADTRWRGLYRIAGVALLMTLFLSLTQMFMFLSWETFPNSTHDWFWLFQSHRLLGLYYLVDFTIFTLIVYWCLDRKRESNLQCEKGLYCRFVNIPVSN